ncbi:MAG TPA: tetratricopeptide repeat protein [Spirochaetota bacterium]|nr:tetratricopeptide repeat protein [Spirochaetota bacterium]HPU87205.1 tetratricopeptide repeat protein [Spirochaetota bacterium]
MIRAGRVMLIVLLACSCGGGAGADERFAHCLALYQKRDLAGAERCLRECVSSRPGHVEAWRYLAMANFHLGRDREFAEAVEQYRTRSNDALDALRLEARWHIRAKRPDEAKQLLERALAGSPDDIVSLYLLGALHADAGRTTEALAAFERALGQYAYLSRIHEAVGPLYAHMGLDDRARAHRAMRDSITRWMEERK